MKSQIIEISEAEKAGKDVITQIELINNQLRKAKTWGYIDMFSNSGLLTALAKHSHLHDAQDMLDELNYRIDKFNAELSDIRVDTKINDIIMSQGIEIADWVIDGLIIDAVTLSKIAKSQKQIDQLKKDVNYVLNELDLIKNKL